MVLTKFMFDLSDGKPPPVNPPVIYLIWSYTMSMHSLMSSEKCKIDFCNYYDD